MQALAILILIGLAIGLFRLCFKNVGECGSCFGECFCETCGPPLFFIGVILFWGGALVAVLWLLKTAFGG
jgi:H+/Cl- antiporter ClcA